jgi:hypothetical protein
MSRRRMVLAGLAAVAALGATRYSTSPHGAPSPIDGVWQYINPGMQGQSFIFEGRYVHFTAPSPASASDTAAAYTVDAGTFSIKDGIVTAKRTFASDTRLVGQAYRWTSTMKGDTAAYRVIDMEGKELSSGRAVRLRAGP